VHVGLYTFTVVCWLGPEAVGLYQLADWLAACWAATVTWHTCRYLIGPCVFNNVGRWPKRAGCSSSMQLPLPTATACAVSQPSSKSEL